MSNLYDYPPSQHWKRAVASSSERLAKLLKAPPCPRCGAPMWLSRLEPHPAPNGGADDMIYDCGCGEQLTCTVETPQR